MTDDELDTWLHATDHDLHEWLERRSSTEDDLRHLKQSVAEQAAAQIDEQRQ